MNYFLTKTPWDALHEGNQNLGPSLVKHDDQPSCRAIYGFSGKDAYERFRSECSVPLTPYPLVKGYLRNRIAEFPDAILLVAIDAAGPTEPSLDAATMQSVLQAQQENSDHVAISHRLVWDGAFQGYRIKPASPVSDVPAALAPNVESPTT